MPFGLRNAPATFQRCMNMVIEGLEEYTGAYIDDLIVYSKSWDDHLSHVTQVLDRLRKHGLTAKESKCEWGASSVTYLGHVVGEGKVSVPEARVAAIRNFKRPQNKSELCAFLGTVGYYRKFVCNYSKIAHPLTEATKKSAPNVLRWSTDIYDAFILLCNCLSDFPFSLFPIPLTSLLCTLMPLVKE